MADKRIVLFCAGGMSTSLLVNKMRDAAAAAGKNYSIDAYGLSSVDKYAPEADCILLGPQVRYAMKQLQAKFPGKPIDGIFLAAAMTIIGLSVNDTVVVPSRMGCGGYCVETGWHGMLRATPIIT